MTTAAETAKSDQLVGYARVSTVEQDLQAQVDQLTGLGVPPLRIYLDHGLSGRNRDRPGLGKALAACHEGSTLVVTKLDRLGRSVPDLRTIVDELEQAGASLSIGGARYDPLTPAGKLLFNALAMVAEFEADLIRQRTIEGMAVARARGRLRGKQPSFTPAQDEHILRTFETTEDSADDIARLFKTSRSSVYRALARARQKRAAEEIATAAKGSSASPA